MGHFLSYELIDPPDDNKVDTYKDREAYWKDIVR